MIGIAAVAISGECLQSVIIRENEKDVRLLNLFRGE